MGQHNQSEQDEEKETRLTIDEHMAIAIGLFGVSLLEAKRMTLYEYGLRTLAFNIGQQKKVELLHIQAWLNQQAKATKKVGIGKSAEYKSAYKDFNDFYSSQEAFERIFDNTKEVKEQKQKLTIADYNRMINKQK